MGVGGDGGHRTDGQKKGTRYKYSKIAISLDNAIAYVLLLLLLIRFIVSSAPPILVPMTLHNYLKI